MNISEVSRVGATAQTAKTSFASLRVVLLVLCCVSVWSMASAREIEIDAEHFSLEFSDGRVIAREQMREALSPTTGAAQFINGIPSIVVTLTRRDSTLGYSRTILEVVNSGEAELPLKRIVLVDAPAPEGARVAGETAGSPIVAGVTFFGVEHPLAENSVSGDRIRCALPVMLPLRAHEKKIASFICGRASEPSQLRRAFANYLEHERPRASSPFLVHNTWYNLGYSNQYSEKDELGLVKAIGRELVEERGVRIDAFVLDDGWDDTRTLWRFHSGWPNGLKTMKAATARWGAVPGIWMSPWGGYNQPKQDRLAAAAGKFEIRDAGFSLAGPKYYERFRELCVQAVREGGVGFFKFDGIGSKTDGTIDPAAGRDFDAMLRLVDELRALRPGLYISQTVGTWPSPWWLLHVDNVWRGGEDHAFAGEGSDRQRWITYRDGQVYANVVKRAPLFPLNSLMLHGVILASHAEGLASTTREDFSDETRSFFGSGAQLQELYLSSELLTKDNWDDLAVSAKWARANADVLKDSHWIGGDPRELEPYGWAAWTSRLGIVTLRNPSSHPASITLNAQSAFELPAGVPRYFRVASAFTEAVAPMRWLDAGAPTKIALKPFQVLVLEFQPTND